MTESSTERAVGQPIAFDDVRVGDTIEARGSRRGVTYLDRGVVGKIDGAYLDTPEGASIVYRHTNRELFLIDRPKPQLPTEIGTIITDATVEGNAGRTLVHRCGMWFDVNEWRWFNAEDVEDWTLAKVVPA